MAKLKQRNKLYFFFPTSIIGFIITLVTRTPFAHVAIEINGKLYDASEKRGDFGLSSIDPRFRDHIQYEFSGNLTEWLAGMTGKKYDWLGVFGWLFGLGDKNKFYCFDAARHALRAVGIVSDDKHRQISGFDLINDLLRYSERLAGGGLMACAISVIKEVQSDFEADILECLSGPHGEDIASSVVDIALSATGAETVIDALVMVKSDKDLAITLESEMYKRMPGLIKSCRQD